MNVPASVITPKVVKWFRLYAGSLTFIYFISAALFLVMYFIGLRFAGLEVNPLREVAGGWLFKLYWFGLTFMFAVSGSAFAATFFLPRKPWAWVYDMILICYGIAIATCIPVAIPLLIYWIKPETRSYFGRN